VGDAAGQIHTMRWAVVKVSADGPSQFVPVRSCSGCYGELTAQVLHQTSLARYDSITVLAWAPCRGREPDVLILLRGNECLHDEHHSDSFPAK
jgi:hypothetical protein